MRKIMNELLEAKLTISKIKTQLLDLAGELVADELTDKQVCNNKDFEGCEAY
jgi:hypothetical protein